MARPLTAFLVTPMMAAAWSVVSQSWVASGGKRLRPAVHLVTVKRPVATFFLSIHLMRTSASSNAKPNSSSGASTRLNTVSSRYLSGLCRRRTRRRVLSTCP
jgi:hypothetical protein